MEDHSGGACAPVGFDGLLTGRDAIEPAAGSVLHLPDAGVVDGAALRCPDGRYGTVVIDALTEAMGELRSFVAAVVERLGDGGELLVDFENAQAPQALRRALDGFAGAPASGSARDPERAASLQQVLGALSAAGAVVVDCVRVPGRPDPALEAFAMAAQAPSFAGGPPPARYWVRARKAQAVAGSVLLGPGSEAQRARTEQALRPLLPADWEIVQCTGDDELAAFNRGVTLSSGRLLWFLRAGAVACPEAYGNLVAAALTGAAMPGGDGAQGGLSGLMIERSALLAAGPLPRYWACPAVAAEDYRMRLEVAGCRPATVAGAFSSPADAAPEAGALERESRQLIELWEGGVDPGGAVAAAPWRGREPRVSLCMITLNEAQFLDECLRRAAPAADEIVIVDSASTDATLAIAARYGARVIQAPWERDFAALRNRGLDAATGDWVLVLDADEMLDDGAADRIRGLVADPKVAGYLVAMRSTYSSGRSVEMTMVRLFQRLEGVRFENRIHEQVTSTLRVAAAARGLAITASDVALEHRGYSDELIRARNKNGRNEELFRLHLQEHPDDIYMLHKYADFVRCQPGRGAEALRALSHALQLIHALPPGEQRGLPYAAEIAAVCAAEQLRSGQVAAADVAVERALRRFVPTPNLYYIAATLALLDGRSDQAIDYFRRCLGFAGRALVVTVQDGVTSWIAWTGIARALLQKGMTEHALRLLARSHAANPDHEDTVLALSAALFEAGDASAALRLSADYMARHPAAQTVYRQAQAIAAAAGGGHTEQSVEVPRPGAAVPPVRGAAVAAARPAPRSPA